MTTRPPSLLADLARIAPSALLMGVFMAGCSSSPTRPIQTEAQLQERLKADIAQQREEFRTMVSGTRRRVRQR